jgi:hypothetical protein
MSVVISTLCGLSLYNSTSNSLYTICKIVHFQTIKVFKKSLKRVLPSTTNISYELLIQLPQTSFYFRNRYWRIQLLSHSISYHSKYVCELDIHHKLCLLLPSYDWLTKLSGLKVGSHCDRLLPVKVDHRSWFQLVYFKTSSTPDHKNTYTGVLINP